MKKNVIYLNDWLAIHPYTTVCSSDTFFVELANKLYAACQLEELPETFRKNLSLYVAAYLEDIISGLGLWQGFTTAHSRLYGRCLPFYPTGKDYIKGEDMFDIFYRVDVPVNIYIMIIGVNGSHQLGVPASKRTDTGLQEVLKSVFPIKDFFNGIVTKSLSVFDGDKGASGQSIDFGHFGLGMIGLRIPPPFPMGTTSRLPGFLTRPLKCWATRSLTPRSYNLIISSGCMNNITNSSTFWSITAWSYI